MPSTRRETITLAVVVVLCLVAMSVMLLVPPQVLEAGLIYQGF